MFRNRWVRRLAVALPVTLVLAIGGWFYVRHKTQQQGLEQLNAVTSRLDATDPRWRLDDIDTDRGFLPDDQNSTLLIPRFKAALAGPSINIARPDKSDVFEKVPQNCRLDDEGAESIDRALAGDDAAIAIARSFRNYPRGLRRYRITPDVVGTLLPDLQDHRTAVLALSLEAERLSRDGRPGAALQLVPAMLNVAHALDGEPFLISALVRIACDAVAVRRLERTLGLGVPRGRLAEVQAALLAEAEGDVFWSPLRSERACLNQLFVNVRAGVVPASAILALTGPAGGPPPTLKAIAIDWAYEPFLAHDHAAFLELMTALCEVGGLPEHQRRAAMRALPVPPQTQGTVMTSLLLPNVEKLHDSSLRHRALFRCAGVALAVERFRQACGHWPDSLAELPKELLRAVPLDPFDGQPLRYARRPDGVTVYSVGFDETDNGGNVTDKPSKEAGVDLGFRLFDVGQRGLPAVERRATEPEEEPGGLKILRFEVPERPAQVPPMPHELGGRGR